MVRTTLHTINIVQMACRLICLQLYPSRQVSPCREDGIRHINLVKIRVEVHLPLERLLLREAWHKSGRSIHDTKLAHRRSALHRRFLDQPSTSLLRTGTRDL